MRRQYRQFNNKRRISFAKPNGEMLTRYVDGSLSYEDIAQIEQDLMRESGLNDRQIQERQSGIRTRKRTTARYQDLPVGLTKNYQKDSVGSIRAQCGEHRVCFGFSYKTRTEQQAIQIAQHIRDYYVTHGEVPQWYREMSYMNLKPGGYFVAEAFSRGDISTVSDVMALLNAPEERVKNCMRSLIDKGLIIKTGRLSTQGRPLTYKMAVNWYKMSGRGKRKHLVLPIDIVQAVFGVKN